MTTATTATTAAPAAAGPIPLPVPSNFPVRWEEPEDAHLLWMFLPTHYPEPMTSLEAWVGDLHMRGFTLAARACGLPLRGASRRVNTYFYAAIVPAEAPPGGDRLPDAMASLGETWRSTWLPEVQQLLAHWEAFDLPGAPTNALLTHLESTVTAAERLHEIHWLGWLPAYMAISLFDELYREVIGAEDAHGAYLLLQGLENKTLETNAALWQLSRRALASAEVRRVLERCAAAEVPAALERMSEGQAFLIDLQAFLASYGRRGDRWSVTSRYWIEDPAPVLKNLKDYVGQPERDLPAELAVLPVEREQAVAAARARLQGQPPATVQQFEMLLTAAQAGTQFSEDHGFWIDSCGLYEVRRVLLEFGRRFTAAGVLAMPEDVFYLTLDEIRETAAARPAVDRRQMVGARVAQMEYFRGIAPPPVLGALPPGPPPDDAVSRMLGKFFGATPPPAEPDVVRGAAGSPGVARGPARVVRSLAEASKLRLGDVLVAETTAPPWTPLFATAAAIVTDTGGILSHCAVVAREYQIPAVVGTGRATTTIKDGQIVEVDGSAGTVRIVSPG